ncbi:MAG: HEPN domain-containing protein [Clostridia bacterium]|nr:HEPN domain-containing protein [Clostridia bacterium]
MYLNHADADITAACLLLSPVGNPTNDEYILDIAAYHVQQGIEKCLKYVLHDLSGADDSQKRFRTHNLLALIALTEEETAYIVPQEIKNIAAMVTSWESSARYGSSPVAAKEQIASVIGLYDMLRTDALQFAKTVSSQ